MASNTVSTASNFTVLLRNGGLNSSSSSSSLEALDSLWIPTCSIFHGPSSMVNFENVGGGAGRTMDNPDENFDVQINQHPGKKRRLSTTQVEFLERSFEVENKLEPERKLQLAKELGLQPRQVAIWFQNRRARYKNKQLEKEFGSLKSCYDKLKIDHDNLLKEKETLKQEVMVLKEKLPDKERGEQNLESQDAIEEPNNDAEAEKPVLPNCSESKVVPIVVCKQEDASSAKSDVFDSDSPHYTDGNHSSLLEPEHSDFSQEEGDHNLGGSFLQVLPCFPKLEDGCYDNPPVNTSSFEFPVEDQPFWTWSY